MKKINYNKKTFTADVLTEAEALKKHATPEEINSLDFSNFNGRDYRHCIYGQMTGDCFSSRASQLIFKCCKRYFYNHKEEESLETHTENGGSPIDFANGKKVSDHIDDFHLMRQKGSCFFSSIEAYIMGKDAKPDQLISYLKGETKTLTL